MKRRCRQPSLHVFSFDSPIRGRYSIGMSATESLRLAALRIISEANSMPGLCRSSVGTTARRIARRPQWASETRTPKKTLRISVRIGLPIQRCVHGIAPSWILPAKREPSTRSAPFSIASTNGPQVA